MPDNRITVRLPDHLLEWIQVQTQGEKGKTSKVVIEALEIARLQMSDTGQTPVGQESDTGQTPVGQESDTGQTMADIAAQLSDIKARLEVLEARTIAPQPPAPAPKNPTPTEPPQPPPPPCRDCGSPNTAWGGYTRAGSRRVRCKDCGKNLTPAP